MHRNFNMTQTAVNYAWQQLAQRVEVSGDRTNCFDALNMGMQYLSPDQSNLQADMIYIVPASSSSWEALLDREPHTLEWLPVKSMLPPSGSIDYQGKLPVLFPGDGFDPKEMQFARLLPSGGLVINVDLISTTLFMLSRWEETIKPALDGYSRFSAEASVAFRQDFLDIPVVDIYAQVLREWVKVLKPGWTPKRRPFHVLLSHDIDHLYYFHPVFPKGLHALYRDLYRQRDIGLFLHDLVNLPFYKANNDPYYSSVYDLAHASRNLGLSSTFFFKSAPRGRFDDGYRIDIPTSVKILRDIEDMGFEIGLHSGFESFRRLELVASEKQRLDSQLTRPAQSVRQHYLRFSVPVSWRIYEEAGFSFDSTLSYAHHVGFRCGTCHPFQVFDIEQDRALNLQEIPLVIMEGCLHQQVNTPLEAIRKRILDLAGLCKIVDGDFTLLWHNTSLEFNWPGWGNLYFGLLPELKALQDD